MGLALAILISFVSVVGISHKEAIAHQHLIKTQKKQLQIKKKAHLRKVKKPKRIIARLDGIEIKNLKG